MIFKLVATVYLLMNGQPVGDPLQMVHHTTFESVEACKAYIASDTGKYELDALNALVRTKLPEGGSHTVTTDRVATKDNTI